MPNVATLSEMLVDLRAELLQSLSAAQATQVEAAHKAKLQRVQRILWQDFAWPGLRRSWDIPMAAGQRYYDLPVGLDLERVEDVKVRWSTLWYPVERGISEEDYNAYDPELDARVDPVLRWDAEPNGQIEVWPLPTSDDGQVLRFSGIQALGRFTEPSDYCTLDRDLIVLNAAAELATDRVESEKLATRARRLYDRLKGGGQFGGARTVNMNGDGRGKGRWPTPPRVAR